MNTYQAKKIPLRDLLSALGHVPHREIKGELWYLSPFRQEGEPSFKVNIAGNVWYDFGLGKGGNVIDFALQFFQISSISGALRELESCMGNPASVTSPAPPPVKAIAQEPKDSLHISKIAPLQNRALIEYLKSRGISVEIARPYLQEIYYTRAEKHYFALAFANQTGGFEIRNAYYKGSVGNKDISIINSGSLNLNAEILVFEGFMDFLSYLVWEKAAAPVLPVIVLNSTAMGEKAINTIRDRGIQSVHLYLDNDTSGREMTGHFQRTLMGVNIFDQSALYERHKDFNEFVQKQHHHQLS